MNDHTNLPAIAPPPPPGRVVAISPQGIFSNRERFDFARDIAKMFAASQLVPAHLREKPNDCIIALNIAERLGEDPLTIMQNIMIVHGTPGWKTSYMIARANRAGVFNGRINWRVEGKAWPGKDEPGMEVTAYSALADTGEVCEVTVTWAMAAEEGWLKNAKYKSMPEHMLRWRSAAMLIRLFAPEVMLGFQTAEEIETEASMKDVSPGRGNTVAGRVQGPPPAPPPVAKSAAADVQNIVDGREPAAASAAAPEVPQPKGEAAASNAPPPPRGVSMEIAQAEEVPGIKSRSAPPPPPYKAPFGKPEPAKSDMDEATEYSLRAHAVKTEEELDKLQRQFLPAFEQRWGMAARNIAQNAYEDTLKRMEAAAKAPPAPQEAQVAPPQAEQPSEFLANSLAQAKQKGAMAAENGMAKTAIPRKFNEDQAAAWLSGYDDAAAKQKGQ